MFVDLVESSLPQADPHFLRLIAGLPPMDAKTQELILNNIENLYDLFHAGRDQTIVSNRDNIKDVILHEIEILKEQNN